MCKPIRQESVGMGSQIGDALRCFHFKGFKTNLNTEQGLLISLGPIENILNLLAYYIQYIFTSSQVSLNPVQILKYGAEEEKSETARMVSNE